MKLNVKILLNVMSAFLAIITLSNVINFVLYQSNYTDMLSIATKSVGNSLLSGIEELLSLGLSIDYLSGMDKKCKRIVDTNKDTISYCYIADLEGKILYHSNAKKMGRVVNDEAMRAALKTKEVFTQQYTSDNAQYLDVTIPISETSGTIVGVIRLGAPMTIVTRKIGEYFVVAIIVIIFSFLAFGCIVYFMSRAITKPLKQITETATRISKGELDLKAVVSGGAEVTILAEAFNSMTAQLRDKAEGYRTTSESLERVIAKAKEIIVSLNSASKEIQAASQEQTSSASEYASGITEVSATLEELSITAKQITGNVGELVLSSEEVTKLLRESEKRLLGTARELEEAGSISKRNAASIAELGKRSAIINEMAELIKDVANKTNILSINASIEASRSGEAGTGFSVVAAEIRELSKETIESAKKAETAAKEIREFLDRIIVSSESESTKVVEGGVNTKAAHDNIESIMVKIGNNNTFTQKINSSIKQQEGGSVQASETMRQMAEIARQSAETVRQTLSAAKDIVEFGTELNATVSNVDANLGKQ
jgi:methyl-accepting chemotaxis protein